MKQIFLLCMLLITIPLITLAGDYVAKGKAGNFEVEAKIDRNPPGRGINNMSIYLKGIDMKPVTDARVGVRYLMPSFPGKEPMMEYSTTAKADGNHYWTQMDLSMAGEWTFIISVSRAGESGAMQFSCIVK